MTIYVREALKRATIRVVAPKIMIQLLLMRYLANMLDPTAKATPPKTPNITFLVRLSTPIQIRWIIESAGDATDDRIATAIWNTRICCTAFDCMRPHVLETTCLTDFLSVTFSSLVMKITVGTARQLVRPVMRKIVVRGIPLHQGPLYWYQLRPKPLTREPQTIPTWRVT